MSIEAFRELNLKIRLGKPLTLEEQAELAGRAEEETRESLERARAEAGGRWVQGIQGVTDN